jgi:hypothetical protein
MHLHKTAWRYGFSWVQMMSQFPSLPLTRVQMMSSPCDTPPPAFVYIVYILLTSWLGVCPRVIESLWAGPWRVSDPTHSPLPPTPGPGLHGRPSCLPRDAEQGHLALPPVLCREGGGAQRSVGRGLRVATFIFLGRWAWSVGGHTHCKWHHDCSSEFGRRGWVLGMMERGNEVTTPTTSDVTSCFLGALWARHQDGGWGQAHWKWCHFQDFWLVGGASVRGCQEVWYDVTSSSTRPSPRKTQRPWPCGGVWPCPFHTHCRPRPFSSYPRPLPNAIAHFQPSPLCLAMPSTSCPAHHLRPCLLTSCHANLCKSIQVTSLTPPLTPPLVMTPPLTHRPWRGWSWRSQRTRRTPWGVLYRWVGPSGDGAGRTESDIIGENRKWKVGLEVVGIVKKWWAWWFGGHGLDEPWPLWPRPIPQAEQEAEQHSVIMRVAIFTWGIHGGEQSVVGRFTGSMLAVGGAGGSVTLWGGAWGDVIGEGASCLCHNLLSAGS